MKCRINGKAKRIGYVEEVRKILFDWKIMIGSSGVGDVISEFQLE